MKQMRALSGALAILAVAVGGSAARAGPLPQAVGNVGCSTNTGNISSAVSCNGGTDSGLVTYAPFAGVQANALGQGLVDNAGVFGFLNYSFEVTGGNPGDVVPIDISTVLQAIPYSTGYAFAEIIVTANTSAGVTICTSGCGVGSGVTGFTGTLDVNALSGTVYTDAIHLEVDVIGALGGTSDIDGGMASVDPHIFVDPSISDPSEYTVLLSDGIGNEIPSASEVPEPSSSWLLVAGLAALAGLYRCRTSAEIRGHSA